MPTDKDILEPSKRTYDRVRIEQPSSIDQFLGLLAGKTDKVATIKEIKEATERAWAGER